MDITPHIQDINLVVSQDGPIDVTVIPAPTDISMPITGVGGLKGDPGTDGADGVTDHGALTGLTDDDHTQYALADGSRGSFAATSHTHTAAQVTDFDVEVSNNTDVAANTSARHTHANSAVLAATTASYTTAEATKLSGIATGATANSSDATLLARANHTGTQSADTLTDGTTNKAFLATERTKLTGIATGATANSSDATLLDRANHTGSQAQSTVTNLVTDLAGKAAASHTHVATTDLTATGTKDATTFLRGDDTWAVPAGGGGGSGANLAATLSATDTIITSDTGTDATIPAVDSTNAGVMTPTQKTKLDGIATGATANSADATLLARANHTGTQAQSTVTDLTTDLAAKASLTGTEVLTNKSLSDSTTFLIDEADGTKKGQFQLSGVTTATTRTVTWPNSSGTMYVTGGTDVSVADGGTGRSTSTTAYGLIAAGTTATGAHQTLATGTAGQILKSNGASALPTFQTGAKADVGLANVDNTSDATKNSASAILTNKTLSTGTVFDDNIIPATALSTTAITLGYSEITSTITTTSTTFVNATGLSSTVTIPAGGRRLKITVYIYAVSNTAVGGITVLTLYEGTIGAGTERQRAQHTSATANAGTAITMTASFVPTAGTKIYNVGYRATTGTSALNVGTTFPGFILVELT